jgi:glutathionylspermidine amidase/synthetase
MVLHYLAGVVILLLSIEYLSFSPILSYYSSFPDDPAPFGTRLGITDGNVIVYSSNYQSPAQENLENYVNGIYSGVKYQCVELARRYWIVNFGYTFQQIPNAYDIFPLEFAESISSEEKKKIEMETEVQGKSMRYPKKGAMLIWNFGGFYSFTGHVAIVVNVDSVNGFVDIVEQNIEDKIWPRGVNYSRRLRIEKDNSTGFITIIDTYNDTSLLGWKRISVDYHLKQIQNQNDDF